MFGFSLSELILVVVVAGVVWLLYKKQTGTGGHGKAKSKAKSKTKTATQTLSPCKICGAYMSASEAVDCGRADCPYKAA